VFGGPVQIAYAVDDVTEAARRWSERGVGPFFVIEHIDVHNVRVDGAASAFDHSSAYAQWGSVMVELICQHGSIGERIVGTSGIHHVACFVENFERAAARLTAAGLDEVLYAETATGMPFAFHDGRTEWGHFIEIYERTDRLGRFYDMVRDAGVGWNGSDPIRVLG
jgi:Glyoxalase/Bleomycin resistance protein/Dioxygenase superfamily